MGTAVEDLRSYEGQKRIRAKSGETRLGEVAEAALTARGSQQSSGPCRTLRSAAGFSGKSFRCRKRSGALVLEAYDDGMGFLLRKSGRKA